MRNNETNCIKQANRASDESQSDKISCRQTLDRYIKVQSGRSFTPTQKSVYISPTLSACTHLGHPKPSSRTCSSVAWPTTVSSTMPVSQNVHCSHQRRDTSATTALPPTEMYFSLSGSTILPNQKPVYSGSTSSKARKPTAPSIRERSHFSVPYANMHTLKGNTTV
jgi:hypothetical protein